MQKGNWQNIERMYRYEKINDKNIEKPNEIQKEKDK